MPAKGGIKADDIARRNAYVEHRIAGVYPTQAARLAGYKNPEESCRDLERNQEIRDVIGSEIANARMESRYTREHVMGRLDDAINMSEMIAEPSSMIRGLQEINKMQGYYAPETKEIILSDDRKDRVGQIQGMSEQELLDKLGKDDAYIDAEFEEVKNE